MATKTYTGKAKGVAYTETVTDKVTPNGTHGLRLTCSCTTHAGTSGVVMIETPTTADEFDRKLIHGWVSLVYSPIAGTAMIRQHKAWKVKA